MKKKKDTTDLEKIWKEQKSFQYNFYDPDKMSEEEKISLTKEYILSIHRELGEVLNIIPWKLHRRQTRKYDKEHIKEELIDCFKFLLNLCIIHGMNPDKFFKLFMKKSKIVRKRFEDEKKKSK